MEAACVCGGGWRESRQKLNHRSHSHGAISRAKPRGKPVYLLVTGMFSKTKKSALAPVPKKAPPPPPDPLQVLKDRREKEIKFIEDHGVAPREGKEDTFYCVKEKDVYEIPRVHLIPVNAPCSISPTMEDLENGKQLRDKIGQDNVFVIDAAHECFQTFYNEETKEREPWDLKLTDEERTLHLYKTGTVDAKTGRTPKCKETDRVESDPKIIVTSEEWLALNAAWKASYASATGFWLRFIAGAIHDEKTGSLVKLTYDKSTWNDQNNMAEIYEQQRAIFKDRIGKLLLLYPHQLDPVHGTKGSLFQLGSIKTSLETDSTKRPSTFKPYEVIKMTRNGEEKDVTVYVTKDSKLREEYAPQLCMQVTVINSKNDDSSRLTGPHDFKRIIPLPTVCVQKVLDINNKYDLGYECLANMERVRETSAMSLEEFRKKHRIWNVAGYHAPEAPPEDPSHVDSEWKNSLRDCAFRKPWVFPRTWKGEVGTTATPLQRGRAEELNGIKLIDLDKRYGKDNPRHQELSKKILLINNISNERSGKRKASEMAVSKEKDTTSTATTEDTSKDDEIKNLQNLLSVTQADLATANDKLNEFKTLKGNKKRIKICDGDELTVSVSTGNATIFFRGDRDKDWSNSKIETNAMDVTNSRERKSWIKICNPADSD